MSVKNDLIKQGIPVIEAEWKKHGLGPETIDAVFERELTKEEVQLFLDYQSGATYVEKRTREYPPVEEFMDAYYWHLKGNDELLNAWVKKCDEVKKKYPK